MVLTFQLHNFNAHTHTASIQCRLYTHERPARVHVNELWGNNCSATGVCTVPVDDTTAIAR